MEKVRNDNLNVRGTMNSMAECASLVFTRTEAKESYIRHAACRLARDTGKVFKVKSLKEQGTLVIRIA